MGPPRGLGFLWSGAQGQVTLLITHTQTPGPRPPATRLRPGVISAYAADAR